MKFPKLLKGTSWDFQKRQWGKGKGKKGKYTEDEKQKIKKLKELYKEYRGLIRAGLPGVKNITFEFKPGSKYGASIGKMGLTEKVIHQIQTAPKFYFPGEKFKQHVPKEHKYKIKFGKECFNNETYLRQVMIHELMHVRFWKNDKVRHHTKKWRRIEKGLFKKAGLPEQWINPRTGEIGVESEKPYKTTGRTYIFGRNDLLKFLEVRTSQAYQIKRAMEFYYFDSSMQKKHNYDFVVMVQEGNIVPNISVAEERINAAHVTISPIDNKETMKDLLINKKGKEFLRHYLENFPETIVLNAYQLFHEIGHLTEELGKFNTEEEADKFADKLLDRFTREVLNKEHYVDRFKREEEMEWGKTRKGDQ